MDYVIQINEESQKGKILLDLLNLLGISYRRYHPTAHSLPLGKKITRELTADEEKEAFLYTSKIYASRAFADKI